MTQPTVDVAVERELRALAATLTDPLPRECLLCYVARMLVQSGCRTTLRFAPHHRDLRAPRVAGLEARLGGRGGFCDCEILLNGYELKRSMLNEVGWLCPSVDHSDGDCFACDDALSTMPPPCAGVRKGSTQGCRYWEPLRRRRR